jgi:cysteine desulfurase
MTRPIYLDYGATTPLDPQVAAVMEPWGVRHFGNPHSAHLWGYEAKAAVEIARGHVAALLNARPETIAFTSGATESVNWALKGLLMAPGQTRRRIVTLATEHSCVLETAEYLASIGALLTIVPVRANGIVDLGDLSRALGEDVAIVSAMAVNNEIGVLQPLADISRAAKAVGAIFHVDAAQGFGKVPLDVEAMGIDLLSLTAHKMHGPKGVGALYRRPFTVIAPLLHGGGQEDGRSGTLPTPLIVGLGEAARLASLHMARDHADALALRTRLLDRLHALGTPFTVHGDLDARWPGNLNLGFPALAGRPILPLLPGIAASSGSACSQLSGRPSHVLTALGLAAPQAKSALRLGFGRFTTPEEVDIAAQQIHDAVLNVIRESA